MIGILPAAGYATRLGPLRGSKELLEVGGLPVIEYSVRRLETGGCSEIRVVTRAEKEDLCAYAERRGLRVMLGQPQHVGASVGLALADVPGDELVALAYPDTLWEPLDGFAILRAALGDEADVALGLFETPDAFRSDVVRTDGSGLVLDILVKPPNPPSRTIWGCLVARYRALAHVEAHAEVTDALREAITARRVTSRKLSNRWLDVGVPEALNLARSGDFSPLST